MNQIDKIYQQSKSIEEFSAQYLDYLSEIFKRIDHKKIEIIANEFISARDSGKKLIFIGNGGSAATASHFANDLAIGTRCPWKPFKALSLTDNVAVLTCIGNDFGYDQLFVKQLETNLEVGDRVVVISASGNSPNLLEAVKFCKSKGNQTIGLLGFDGGELKKMCDISLVVETAKGEYGPVEDVHMIVDHLVSSYLIRYVKANS